MTDTPYVAPSHPAHLHSTGARAWREWCEEWRLDSADDLQLLRLGCEALDRAAQARRTLRDKGLFWEDRLGNIRSHPAVAVEAKSRGQAANIFGQIQRSQLAMQRIELAAERHARVVRDKELAHEKHRDRRGGGVRRA